MRYFIKFPAIASLVVVLTSAPWLINPSFLHQKSGYGRVMMIVNHPFSGVLQNSRTLAGRLHSPAPDWLVVVIGMALELFCWAALAAIVGAIFDFTRSRSPLWMERTARNPQWFFLAGVPAYLGCADLHICMDGHMRHPPYAIQHYILDVFWVSIFLVAAIRGYAAKAYWHRSWFWLIMTLTLSRLPLGSYGSWTFPVEVFALIFLLFLSIRGLLVARQKSRATPSIE